MGVIRIVRDIIRTPPAAFKYAMLCMCPLKPDLPTTPKTGLKSLTPAINFGFEFELAIDRQSKHCAKKSTRYKSEYGWGRFFLEVYANGGTQFLIKQISCQGKKTDRGPYPAAFFIEWVSGHSGDVNQN
jgi:hypothetical protein